MNDALSKSLVLTMLQHAEDFPWRMQDIGLMACAWTTGGSTGSTSGTRATATGNRPSTTTPMTSPRRSSPVS